MDCVMYIYHMTHFIPFEAPGDKGIVSRDSVLMETSLYYVL
jgi:hypothetical protein